MGVCESIVMGEIRSGPRLSVKTSRSVCVCVFACNVLEYAGVYSVLMNKIVHHYVYDKIFICA